MNEKHHHNNIDAKKIIISKTKKAEIGVNGYLM